MRNLEPNAVCQSCGKAFRGRKDAKFCSTKCRDIARMKRQTVVCANCGKTFEKTLRQAQKWNTHFCSMECYTKWKNQNGMTMDARIAMRAKKLKPEQTRNRDNYLRVFGKRVHRVVAEKMLGRPLRPGEVVHHINGDKHDNRPENLMVFPNQQEHAAYHTTHPFEGGDA